MNALSETTPRRRLTGIFAASDDWGPVVLYGRVEEYPSRQAFAAAVREEHDEIETIERVRRIWLRVNVAQPGEEFTYWLDEVEHGSRAARGAFEVWAYERARP